MNCVSAGRKKMSNNKVTMTLEEALTEMRSLLQRHEDLIAKLGGNQERMMMRMQSLERMLGEVAIAQGPMMERVAKLETMSENQRNALAVLLTVLNKTTDKPKLKEATTLAVATMMGHTPELAKVIRDATAAYPPANPAPAPTDSNAPGS
jgi:hypothetical protein